MNKGIKQSYRSIWTSYWTITSRPYKQEINKLLREGFTQVMERDSTTRRRGHQSSIRISSHTLFLKGNWDPRFTPDWIPKNTREKACSQQSIKRMTRVIRTNYSWPMCKHAMILDLCRRLCQLDNWFFSHHIKVGHNPYPIHIWPNQEERGSFYPVHRGNSSTGERHLKSILLRSHLY